MKYMKGTTNYKLYLQTEQSKIDSLLGYADADWAGDFSDRKSNSGYVFLLNGSTISWAARKQDCVALSSTEAEYIALAEAIEEGIWLKQLLSDFKYDVNFKILEDNQSCIKLTRQETVQNILILNITMLNLE